MSNISPAVSDSVSWHTVNAIVSASKRRWSIRVRMGESSGICDFIVRATLLMPAAKDLCVF